MLWASPWAAQPPLATPTKSTGWFANFMKANPSGSVDFICVHWYGPPTASSLLNVVDTLWAQYKKPIWITEFAVANWTQFNTLYPRSQPSWMLSSPPSTRVPTSLVTHGRIALHPTPTPYIGAATGGGLTTELGETLGGRIMGETHYGGYAAITLVHFI